MTSNAIQQRLTACGIPCDAALAERLATYMRLLAEWNQVMDLTAVTEEDETLDRHFADSLAALTVPGLIPQTGALADVGTGAGFPGLPLAIMLPEVRFTLVDALGKRVEFLRSVIDALGLNAEAVHLRAEGAARRPDLRERFDLAVARAVAPMNVLCEYLLPFVAPGGAMLALKGPGLDAELKDAESALAALGGALEGVTAASVPNREWDHRAAWVRKVAPTPEKYPRRAGVPEKKPL